MNDSLVIVLPSSRTLLQAQRARDKGTGGWGWSQWQTHPGERERERERDSLLQQVEVTTRSPRCCGMSPFDFLNQHVIGCSWLEVPCFLTECCQLLQKHLCLGHLEVWTVADFCDSPTKTKRALFTTQLMCWTELLVTRFTTAHIYACYMCWKQHFLYCLLCLRAAQEIHAENVYLSKEMHAFPKNVSQCMHLLGVIGNTCISQTI